MYCPNCGQKIKGPHWKVEDPMAGTKETDIKCPKCKKKLHVVDTACDCETTDIDIIYK